MAKKLHIEDLVLNVLVNGDPARKKMLDLANQIKDDNAELQEMRKHLSGIENLMGGKGSDAYKKQAAAIKQHEESIKASRQQLKGMMDDLKTDSLTIAELKDRIKDLSNRLKDIAPGTEEWKKFNSRLQETKARLKELQTQGAQTEGVLKRFWTSAAGAVAMVQAGWAVLLRVARGLRGAFDTLKDFEQANVNLATILGRNVKEIADLTDQAERLGSTTRYTASQVTGLQTELAKMGFTESQIKAMSEPILNFATALSIDLPEAAALAASALRMFGLKSKDTEDTLAAITISTNRSALNFRYLETALSTVGPVARTFGFDLKDTVSLLGALANAGFDASSAATATRNILLKLADANGKLAKELGGPCRTLPELVDGLKKLDEKGVDLATTLDLVGTKAVSAFNTFLRSADDVAVLRGELEDTSGVLKEIADERADTLAGALDRLKSAWEGLILKLKGSTGTLKEIADMFASIFQSITPGHKLEYNVKAIIDVAIEAAGGDIDKAIEGVQKKLFNASRKLENVTSKKDIKYWTNESTYYTEALKRLQSQQVGLKDDDESGGTGGTGGSTGGGSGGGGDNDNKHKASWSLQSDEAFLAAKAELTRQFNEGEIKSQKEYDEQLYQLEVATLTARLASHKDSSKDRLKIEVELQDKIMKHKQNAAKEEEKLRKEQEKLAEEGRKIVEEERQAELSATDKKLEAEVKRYEEEKKKFQGDKDALEAIEKKHRRTMMQIRIEAENEAFKNLQTRHELERQQLENQWTARIALAKKGSGEEAELRKKMNEELARMDLVYLESLKATLETIVEAGALDGVYLNDEQILAYQKKLAEVIKQINSVKDALKSGDAGILSGTGNGSFLGVALKDWELLISHMKEGKLTAEDLAKAMTGVGGAAEEGFKIAKKAIDLINAKEKKALNDYKKGQDSRKKALEERYRAGLMTESQYNAEVEKMEAEMQAKEEEAELEAARRTKTMSIIESIINTALAATKALAQGGFPAGAVMAGIVTAIGAAQTAMIAAQPVGYADGGYIVKRRQDGKQYDADYAPDKRGYVKEPTVLVGEDGPEYVIPAEALENPQIRMVVDTIESARKSGRLRSLRMEAISPAMSVSGRAAGGYTSGAAPADMSVALAELDRMSETVDRLNTILENGIDANVSMLGPHGLVNKINEYNRAKNRGNLYDRDTNQIRTKSRSRSGR